MPVLINDILFIEGRKLVKKRIISSGSLRVELTRQRNGKLQCWRYERFTHNYPDEFIQHRIDSRKGVVYFYFESLRDKYKEAIKDKLCKGHDPYLYAVNKNEILKQERNEQSRRLRLDLQARELELRKEDYTNELPKLIKISYSDENYLIQNGLSVKEAGQMARTCGWLDLLAAMKPKKAREFGFENMPAFREYVFNTMASEFKQGLIKFKDGMPSNIQILGRYERDWKDNGPKCMLTGRRGNTNRSIIGKSTDNEVLMVGRYNIKEWHAATIITIYTNPGDSRKFDKEETYRRYKRQCEKADKRPASIGAMKRFLNDQAVNVFCMGERDGYKELDKLMPSVRREKPKMSLIKGGFDGFQVDFYSEIDGANIMLTVEALFDYSSDAITGFDIGLVENGLMVRNMLRSHFALNDNRGFIELESDRGTTNLSAASKSIINRCCGTFKAPAPNWPVNVPGKKKPSNPKGRRVERIVREVNRIAQNMEGWKGGNVKSVRSNMEPNPDYKLNNLPKGLEAAKQAVISLINAYNHEKLKNGASRWDNYINNINTDAPVILPLQQSLILNEWSITTVRAGLVSVELDKETYEFDFWNYLDYAHKLNKGFKCRVSFDPQRADKALIFAFDEKDRNNTEKDRFVCEITKLKRVKEALYEQTDDDRKELGRQHSNRNKVILSQHRKYLELQASKMDLDIGDMDIKDAQKIVSGALLSEGIDCIESFTERFGTPLNSKEAKRQEEFYKEMLLPGINIPVRSLPAENNESEKRKHQRKKFAKKAI